MKYILILLLLLVFIFLQSTLFGIPFVVLFLLSLVVLYRSEVIFILAFFAGVLIDMLMIRPLGETSMFLLVYILLIFLYEQKFELKTLPFICVMSFFGSLFYFFCFGSENIFLQLLLSEISGVSIFLLFRLFERSKKKETLS